MFSPLLAYLRNLSPTRRAIRPERLQALADEDLAVMFHKWNNRHHVAVALEAELAMRDAADQRARAAEQRERARAERRKAREREMRDAYQLVIESAYVAAEEAARGHMLNPLGERQEICPRSLFSGPAARACKYASEELRNHWESHPRITYAEFKRQSREPQPVAA